MFSIHSCPDGRPLAVESAMHVRDGCLLLRLQENRSHLSQEARVTFTALIVLFMATAILPAFSGELLLPVLSIATMALLAGAIEWHKRSKPATEWLAIEKDRLRYRSDRSDTIDLPVRSTVLVEDAGSPLRLRLFLESQRQKIEIGHCLSLEEKRAIAPLIAGQLGQLTKAPA